VKNWWSVAGSFMTGAAATWSIGLLALGGWALAGTIAGTLGIVGNVGWAGALELSLPGLGIGTALTTAGGATALATYEADPQIANEITTETQNILYAQDSTQATVSVGSGTLPHDIESETTLQDMSAQDKTKSCVPACVRELLRREKIEMSEDDIIKEIGSDPVTGDTRAYNNQKLFAFINRKSSNSYTDELDFAAPNADAAAKNALEAAQNMKQPWIAFVGTKIGAHAVIVERVIGDTVTVSDPFPWDDESEVVPGAKAIQYPMKWSQFYQKWASGTGLGVVPKQ
jgi:hypothetical protein